MGLGTDGGLLLPETMPRVDDHELKRWADLAFAPLAVEIISLFVSQQDIPKADLKRLVEGAFSTFSHSEVTPLVRVGDRFILELFHGPTLAFKDVALQFLGRLFEYLLGRDGGRLNIVGATSGDTGSAAIHGVRGRKGIEIFILHPHGRVSTIQERQMTSVLDANVHNIAIQGTFDDGQAIVKELFNDLKFKDSYQLGAVNSINWARIVAQVVYYFYAWGRVTGGDPSREVVFSVPTGNFGDIFAGYVAKCMGLPMGKLILATNHNDILARFFATGEYRLGTVRSSMSPSMDIQVSSNFERYLYYLLEQDASLVREKMADLARYGVFSVSREKLDLALKTFTARAVDEETTLSVIRDVYRETGYVLDPHTAVGVGAVMGEADVVCLATAHPAKFGDAVFKAIGRAPFIPASLEGLSHCPTRCHILPAQVKEVRDHIIATLA